MVRTAEAKRFFAAWQALRAGNDIPHYRRAFQDLPRDILPNIMLYEEHPEGRYIVRFMGTYAVDLWGVDLTGRDILGEFDPKISVPGRKNLVQVLDHPCGLVSAANFHVKSRGELVAEGVVVPVANDAGLPRRMLNFAQQIRPPFGLADDRPNVAERSWIDLGFGVPARKPAV